MALKGITVIELAGLAPAPFAGMILSDFGANVIRVDHLGKSKPPDGLSRGKRSIAINLRDPKGLETMKHICNKADVLIEPFRPGVMEKLGLGPNVLTATNPKLVYARLSGFGQSGLYKHMAGHDINYIATSGILSALAKSGEKPFPPLNLLADFAGGGLTCAFGVVAALLEREKSGQGQVVDVNMTAGSAYLASFVYSTRSFFLTKPPGENVLDTGAPFYNTYKTKDDKFVAVGALEPQFFNTLIEGLGIDEDDIPTQMDSDNWPKMREIFEEKIGSLTRDELAEIFDGKDACLTPILDMDEAPNHPHNKDNDSFHLSEDGITVPSPAPKLSRTPAMYGSRMNIEPGEDTRDVLKEFQFTNEEIYELEAKSVINKPLESSKL